MTPATTLTRAIEAAQSDPHGGKVMLTIDEAQAVLAEVERLREAGEMACNRLELIAGDAWRGDGRDLKRSIHGVFAEFRTALGETP